MKTIKIRCTGKTALLMDAMSEEAVLALIRKQKMPTTVDVPFPEIASKKIYRDVDGKAAIPSSMLFAALNFAGRSVPFQGKTKVATATTSNLPSFFSINETHMRLFNPEKPEEESSWVHDVRKGNLHSGPKPVAVGIVRPRFDRWAFNVEAEYDDDVVKETLIIDLFKYAGTRAGLGSFRPNCKGIFGQFKSEVVNAKVA